MSIHFTMQGKGGVGKTITSSYNYQVAKQLGHDVIAFDTDPVNATLLGYKDFNVTRIKLLNEDENINHRNFDILLEDLAQSSIEKQIIIDNGASSFIALCAYMKENEMIETLGEFGHQVYLHTVLTGGQALEDTITGFIDLADNFPNVPLVVWLNPFFGAIEMDGKPFTEFQSYKDYEQNVHALIELPTGNKELIGKDLEQVFMKKQSFADAIAHSNNIAVRSRLAKYWKHVSELLQNANIY